MNGGADSDLAAILAPGQLLKQRECEEKCRQREPREQQQPHAIEAIHKPEECRERRKAAGHQRSEKPQANENISEHYSRIMLADAVSAHHHGRGEDDEIDNGNVEPHEERNVEQPDRLFETDQDGAAHQCGADDFGQGEFEVELHLCKNQTDAKDGRSQGEESAIKEL